MGLVGYLLYPIIFVSQFWLFDTQLERLIYLGLLLATHLGKSKVCAIILIALGGLFTIAGIVILRVGATGFAAIGIGIWALLLLNVLSLGFVAFAIVDCSRLKIKRKALWILLLVFGFVTLGATVSGSMFRIHFNFSWLTNYSALIRYGSGTAVIRLMLPIGAIVYFCTRRSLLKTAPENTPAEAAPDENDSIEIQES